ncbi:hypothetical protein [Pseudomonas sp. BN515]|uniref:hypothetical protein n=1 Tax=Pseudomonas sp. BN515 TaxID=2567892 RepID=UPI00245522E4|nr:hypothetical protein [Pseudomonas sp. BN515]MDH4872500.1 hypothetical protein [Pseudomonas sp. BN515]
MPETTTNNTQATDHPNVARITETLSIIASTLLTLATLIWILTFSNHGIDFSDEGFYLAWISDPWIYQISTTQFGFVYHPLYLLANGDIVLLRQGNFLITFLLAWLLCVLFFRSTLRDTNSGTSWSSLPMLGIAGGLALTSLAMPHSWLPTPNYNSLTLQSLLLSTCGLLLAERAFTRASIIGWALTGAGGWLALMAKPTSAILLGFTSLLYLLIAGKLNLRLLLIALLTTVSLLSISAWIIDGSISGFYLRIIYGLEATKLLGAGHSPETLLIRLWSDTFYLTPIQKSATWLLAVSVFTLSYLTLTRKSLPNLITLCLCATLSAFCIATILTSNRINYTRTGFEWAIFLSILPGTLLLALIELRKRAKLLINRNCIALIVFSLLIPHALAFGTNNNYWLQGSFAAIFWLLSGLAPLCIAAANSAPWRVFLPITVAAQAITVTLVSVSMDTPYRQSEKLREQHQPVVVGKGESKLYLSASSADYLRALNKAAVDSRFESGTPVIDLTGASPGALFAINAKIIGQAWMIGGLPGSEALAVSALDRVSCNDLAKSWILVQPGGPRRLSPHILQRYGIDPSTEFESSRQFPAPIAGASSSYSQQLLKPTRSVESATAACEKSRANRT